MARTCLTFALTSAETPLANLWLSMLHRMGVEVERFGDSTGRLNTL
jgi:hypothetical protein